MSNKLTFEEVEEIFENDDVDWEGDNAFKGLQILSKFTDNLIQGANHEIIYSEDINKLIAAGMTKDDFKKLQKLNWIIEDDYLACFV